MKYLLSIFLVALLLFGCVANPQKQAQPLPEKENLAQANQNAQKPFYQGCAMWMGCRGMMMEHDEDGIEWEDTMFGMNLLSTNENLEWRIIDSQTGKWNMNATREVSAGKPIKIRLNNTKVSVHPMQHPIHLHGARFL